MNQEYKIKPIQTQKDQIKNPKLADEGVIPKLNTSSIIVGKSGSGKTVLLANLMKNPLFYSSGKFFSKTFLISPTGCADDVQKSLGVPESCTFTDLEEAVEALKKIEVSQEQKITEMGASKAPKFCVILDDCIGSNKFMNSKEFINLFTKARHYNITVFFLSQHFKRLPKICRLQASHLYFFAISNTEAEALAEEFAPPGMPKKSFMRLIDDVLTEPYQFLSISMKHGWNERFRKGLAMVINLDEYKNGKV